MKNYLLALSQLVPRRTTVGDILAISGARNTKICQSRNRDTFDECNIRRNMTRKDPSQYRSGADFLMHSCFRHKFNASSVRTTTTVAIKTKQNFMHTQKRLQLRRTVANVNDFGIIRHFNETHVARAAISPRRLQRTSLLHVVFIRCWRCCAFQSK